ncbi:MAG: T9SS type A sorting domain-containing protein [candidate division Zixibacteria bacterium]|nr:T9SS type A sorting domain-containing protein [candidate division Zixibacteria bacterium]
MTRFCWSATILFLTTLALSVNAELIPQLDLQVTVPDSVNISGRVEFTDVTGDGFAEMILRDASPIVSYSLHDNRVLDYFRLADDGLQRLYKADYIDGDDRLDVVKAVLFRQDSTLTYSIVCYYGGDSYLAIDTLYSVSGLDSSRSYVVDKLYLSDVDRDGRKELYAQYYYYEDFWVEPTEVHRYYYYSPLCYDFVTSAISVPTQLPADITPFYESSTGDGGIAAISSLTWSWYSPSHHGSGSRSESSFSVIVEDTTGTRTSRGFSSIVSCENDQGSYNDYGYGASLISAAAGDILPGTPGLEMIMYVAYSFSVAGPSSYCYAKERQLVLFNLLDPANWVTVTNVMPCDTAIAKVFHDPRFDEAFLSLVHGIIRLHDATTFEIVDQSVAPITGIWVGYIPLQSDQPPVAVFRYGRTFSFYALSQVPTDVEDDPAVVLPDRFTLGQPYPNPFNPTVTVPIAVSSKGHLKVEVYNPLGQRVTVLHDAVASAGEITLSWDATDFGSGVYLIKATLGEETRTAKAVLVK